jgi:hypothetical protein
MTRFSPRRLLALVGVALVTPYALDQTSGCPPPSYNGAQWPQNSVVYYDISNLDGTQQSAAKAVIDEWNNANQTNGSNVVFLRVTVDSPPANLVLSNHPVDVPGTNRPCVPDTGAQTCIAYVNSLRLWIDKNHDGISQPSELYTLPSLGVLSIDLNYKEDRRKDKYGNVFRYRARINNGDPNGLGPMAYDVLLQSLQSQARIAGKTVARVGGCGVRPALFEKPVRRYPFTPKEPSTRLGAGMTD